MGGLRNVCWRNARHAICIYLIYLGLSSFFVTCTTPAAGYDSVESLPSIRGELQNSVAESPRFMPIFDGGPSYDRVTAYAEYAAADKYIQVLPQGLMYTSYLAGVKEPRLASQWEYEKDFGWMWDVTLGGRVGLLRYGTNDPLNPQGWQIDLEGAALPRLSLEHERDVVSCDYRAGVPLTHAIGKHHYKLAYYHLSAHLGDEWMLRFPGIRRINYSRDVITFGYSYYWIPNLRLYGEAGYAFYRGDYTKPWEFQFGVEFSPAMPTGLRPAPFMAVNGYLREDNDYSGNLTVEMGLQWRGWSGNLFRMGMIYFCGMSDQYEFFDDYENKIGMGLWYDF